MLMINVLRLVVLVLCAMVENCRTVGWKIALIRNLRSWRVFLVPELACALVDARTRVSGTRLTAASHLSFIQHRHYLTRGLSSRQRLLASLRHTEFIERTFAKDFTAHLTTKEEIPLWSRNLDMGTVTVSLRSGNMREGDLSATAAIDGRVIGVMSFSFTGIGTSFEPDARTTLFIVRSQSGQNGSKDLIDLPVSRGQLLCMAAVEGIAMAAGAARIVGVSHRGQYCYEEGRHSTFFHSYDEIWLHHGGEPSKGGFSMPLPIAFRPLDQISRNHRQRAKRRRALHAEISSSSVARISDWLAVNASRRCMGRPSFQQGHRCTTAPLPGSRLPNL